MKALWTKKDLMTATNALDPSSYFLENFNGVSGVSIDDRTINKGDLFIAIIGDKFDGHDFIKNAIRKGAYGIIVSDKMLANKYKALLVEDTKKALEQIAKFSRHRFKGVTIAITGSSGKTSTKHLLSNTLKKFGKTHHTDKNNNNLIGLSLTLSRLHNDYDYCVLELGMNNAGEIQRLTEIALPDIALITNISSSHIQNFKNDKEIADEKSEIFSTLNENGIAIINTDTLWSKYLIKKAKNMSAKIHLFGYSKYANTKITKLVDKNEGSTIYYDKIENLYLKYLNTTQAENVIASISVIKELKLETKKVKKIISNLRPLYGRGAKLVIDFDCKQKTIIIDDSYNANPASMKAALYNFNNFKIKYSEFESVAIIGDMLELGKSSKALHLDLVPILKKINPNLLLTVGKYSKKISDKLNSTTNCYSFVEVSQLIEEIRQFIKPNQIVLLKGSNSIGLWKLVPIFKDIIQENVDVA